MCERIPRSGAGSLSRSFAGTLSFHPLRSFPERDVPANNDFLSTPSFQVWGRHSWRESANEGLYHKLVFCCLMGALHNQNVFSLWMVASSKAPKLASILETAENAAYSSLRRKKIHSLSGVCSLKPRLHSEQLRKAEPSFLKGNALALRGHPSAAFSKPSLALTDFVVFLDLRSAESRKIPSLKAKAGIGEGSWGFVLEETWSAAKTK